MQAMGARASQLTCIHDPGSLIDACSVVVGTPQMVRHDGCGAALAHAHLEARAAEQHAIPPIPLCRPELYSRMWPLRVNGTLLDSQAPQERSLEGVERNVRQKMHPASYPRLPWPAAFYPPPPVSLNHVPTHLPLDGQTPQGT